MLDHGGENPALSSGVLQIKQMEIHQMNAPFSAQWELQIDLLHCPSIWESGLWGCDLT